MAELESINFYCEGKMPPKPNLVAKVVLVGSCRTGKTAFAERCCGRLGTPGTPSEFDDQHKYRTTIGADFFSFEADLKPGKTLIQVWDISGHDKYSNSVQAFLRGANVVLGFASDESSAEAVTKWHTDTKVVCPDARFRLIAVDNIESADFVADAAAQALGEERDSTAVAKTIKAFALRSSTMDECRQIIVNALNEGVPDAAPRGRAAEEDEAPEATVVNGTIDERVATTADMMRNIVKLARFMGLRDDEIGASFVKALNAVPSATGAQPGMAGLEQAATAAQNAMMGAAEGCKQQ